MWNVSTKFLSTLRAPVLTTHTEMRVLDTSFNPIAGGVFYGVAHGNDATDVLIDGSVDVDISRGTRRTFTVSLNNPGGIWSPNHQWGGYFYVNRLIQLWRGLDYGGGVYEMVPVGTFYIDTADVVVERNMSMVVLAGSDQWKRFTKSKFPHPKSWAAGTGLNTVIRDIAGDVDYPNPGAGVSRFRLDPLSDRSTNAKTLNTKLSVEKGDVRSDVLTKLAVDYGLELYFDPLGYLASDDLRSDTQEVDFYDCDAGGLAIAFRVSYKDDNLYNHAVVTATEGPLAPITAHKWDDDPSSPTNILKIGDRVDMYETAALTTVEATEACAARRFLDLMRLNEESELDAICNPALEGNDIIRVKETTLSGVDYRYRISSLSVPLTSARQTVKVNRVIKL